MAPIFGILRRASLTLAAMLILASCNQGGAERRDLMSRPKRIVSLNLCADQYVLALADRDQIAGLTRNAADPAMSAAAGRTQGLPILRGTAEEVLAIEPDLVLGMSVRRSDMLTGLPLESYKAIDLKSARSFADIVAQIRDVARVVGHPDRGEALIAQMEGDLAAIPQMGSGKVAAYYQRRGFMTGTGTLMDDLMRRSGLVNLAKKLNKPILAQMTLEEMIAARPDYLVVESASDKVVDQGTEMLHHPLLKDMPRIHLPQAWTVCGGPAYVDAARSLARQLAQVRTGSAH